MTNSKILRGEHPVSASEIPSLRTDAEIPRALLNEEIEQVIIDFGKATKRAIQAGFDGIELHGANTYLLQQFFSPHSNRREDKWGGSIDNRTKFIVKVIEQVNKIVKEEKSEFIVGYRLSPEEIERPGITFSDTVFLSQ